MQIESTPKAGDLFARVHADNYVVVQEFDANNFWFVNYCMSVDFPTFAMACAYADSLNNPAVDSGFVA